MKRGEGVRIPNLADLGKPEREDYETYEEFFRARERWEKAVGNRIERLIILCAAAALTVVLLWGAFYDAWRWGWYSVFGRAPGKCSLVVLLWAGVAMWWTKSRG